MVCLNHPDVNAVAKCAACGKPLCADCVMICDNQKYCSEACHLKGLASSLRSDEVISKKRNTERKSGLKKFITFLIIAAIASGAAYYYSQNKKSIDKRAKAGLETVKSQASKAIEEGKKAVPTNSKYKQHREGLVNEK